MEFNSLVCFSLSPTSRDLYPLLPLTEIGYTEAKLSLLLIWLRILSERCQYFVSKFIDIFAVLQPSVNMLFESSNKALLVEFFFIALSHRATKQLWVATTVNKQWGQTVCKRESSFVKTCLFLDIMTCFVAGKKEKKKEKPPKVWLFYLQLQNWEGGKGYLPKQGRRKLCLELNFLSLWELALSHVTWSNSGYTH